MWLTGLQASTSVCRASSAVFEALVLRSVLARLPPACAASVCCFSSWRRVLSSAFRSACQGREERNEGGAQQLLGGVVGVHVCAAHADAANQALVLQRAQAGPLRLQIGHGGQDGDRVRLVADTPHLVAQVVDARLVPLQAGQAFVEIMVPTSVVKRSRRPLCSWLMTAMLANCSSENSRWARSI